MATSKEYIEFVCEQLDGIENVTYRKMFGEYMVYVNAKPILLVCDNTVMVKKVPELADLMKDAPDGVPYEGAKVHYILDIENRELVRGVSRSRRCRKNAPKRKPNNCRNRPAADEQRGDFRLTRILQKNRSAFNIRSATLIL